MVLVLAQHYGFALAIETNKGIFVNELNPTVIELARLVNHPTPPVADIEKEFMGGECCQLCIYCDEEWKRSYGTTFRTFCFQMEPFLCGCQCGGSNKAMGINEFASYYGFDVSGTIAFGDGGNDISMIRAARDGNSYGRSFRGCESVADYITETVDEHGIRNALVRFGILE